LLCGQPSRRGDVNEDEGFFVLVGGDVDDFSVDVLRREVPDGFWDVWKLFFSFFEEGSSHGKVMELFAPDVAAEDLEKVIVPLLA